MADSVTPVTVNVANTRCNRELTLSPANLGTMALDRAADERVRLWQATVAA